MAQARLSKSLMTLRDQVNKLAPKRSKASDGWIADSKHSMRKSDHNPEPDGTVDALDITHDPKGGVDIQKLCDAIIASKDKRVSYLICNGKIIAGAGGPQPWVKRIYNGPNKHTKHLHVSILDKHQDDTTPWKIEAAFGKKPAAAPAKPQEAKKPVPAPVEPIKPQPTPAPAPASEKDIVEAAQRRLIELGYTEVGGVDGKIGPLTKAAILAFRNDNGLPLVDRIDKAFLTALATAKPRKLAPERTAATPAEVREKVPEAKASWWVKIVSAVTGIPALITGMAEALTPAKGYIDPLRDLAADVPTFVWFGLIGAVALSIFLLARRSEAKSIEAFQTGERR